MILKEKGHPTERAVLTQMLSRGGRGRRRRRRSAFPPSAAATCTSSSLACRSSRKPIGSTRDFEASTLDPPLGSGPYKVGRFEPGRYIEFERVADYWGKDLPVNVGINNFEHIRFEYYRDRQVAFEAFKAGKINFHEEYTARIWATGYDFPAVREGRVKKEALPNGARRAARLVFQLAPRRCSRIRAFARRSASPSISNGRTRTSCIRLYKRMTSYFENSDMKAVGQAGRRKSSRSSSRSAARSPDECFGEPYRPARFGRLGLRPHPAAAGRRAAARGRLQARRRHADAARRRSPSRSSSSIPRRPCSRIPSRSQANLNQLGIDATLAHRRRGAVQAPHSTSSISTWSAWRSAARARRATICAWSMVRRRRPTPGSRNLAGIADPVVDALIEKIAQRQDARGTDDRLPRASTACSAPAAIGCRCGTTTRRSSPIGTCSRAPTPGRNSAPARRIPGGTMPRKPRRSASAVMRLMAGSRSHGPECPATPLPVSDDAWPSQARGSAMPPPSVLAYIARRILLMIPTIVRDHADLLRHRAIRAGRPGRAHHGATARQRPRRPRASRAAAATSPARPRSQAAATVSPIAAPRASTRIHRANSKSSSASTSRRPSASA